jgi:hypothetical protein
MWQHKLLGVGLNDTFFGSESSQAMLNVSYKEMKVLADVSFVALQHYLLVLNYC